MWHLCPKNDISSRKFTKQQHIEGNSILIAPVFKSSAKRNARKRSQFFAYLPVCLSICLGILLSALAYNLEMKNNRREASLRYEGRTTRATTVLQSATKNHLEILRSLEAFNVSSGTVNRRQFCTFSKHVASTTEDIQALAWVPRVSSDEQAGYIASAQADGFQHFRFTEYKNGQQVVQSGTRSEHFPIYYIEPYSGNRKLLGLDLASNPDYLRAMIKARDSGNEAAALSLPVTTKRDSQYLFIFKPIYRNASSKATISDRRSNLTGFALGIIRTGDMVGNAFKTSNIWGIDAYLVEDAGNRRFVSAHYDDPNHPTTFRQIAESKMHTAKNLQIGDQTWKLLLAPSPQWLRAQFNRPVSTTPVGILILTTLIAAYLLMSMRRTSQIARLADRLSITNEELSHKIGDCLLAETNLHMQTTAINAASDRITITDVDGKIEFVNAAFEIETGYSKEEAVGTVSSILNSGEHSEEFYSQLWKVILAGDTWRGEITSRCKDGSLRTDEVTITPVKSSFGSIEHFVAISRDVSEKKMYEERLYRLAHHDALTSLPNRLLFGDRLNQRLADARRRNELLAVIFLDLDHFKLINDTMGHSTGDLLLKQIAERLKNTLREVDTIARMGGDEFILIANGIKNRENAIEVAQRALAALSQACVINGREFFISASIGISLYPIDGNDVETLVRNADAAMYRAKELGRNTYQLFEEALNIQAVERVSLENSLRKAVERNEFILCYQPVMEIDSGTIIGTEALIRWQNPELGLIYPHNFIPLAEEMGLIVPMTEWVLKTACTQNMVWQNSGFPDLCMAVNISARHFQHDGLLETVASTLNETGMEPCFLNLELTESTLMQNPLVAAQMLERLRAMGIHISVDDFGTGYSSLSYLKRFAVDLVKIDQSFVRNIPDDLDDSALSEAIVAMAHSLKLSVVAEGVETLAQLEFLRSLKCDYMQGYFLSRPASAKELTQLLIESSHYTPAKRLAS